jgi:hypothetical protein
MRLQKIELDALEKQFSAQQRLKMTMQDPSRLNTPVYKAEDAPKWSPQMSLFMVKSKSLSNIQNSSRSASQSQISAFGSDLHRLEQGKSASHRRFPYRAVSITMRDESLVVNSARRPVNKSKFVPISSKRTTGYGLFGRVLLKNPNLPIASMYAQSPDIDISDFCASLSQVEKWKHQNSETRPGTLLDLEHSSSQLVEQREERLPALLIHKKNRSELSFIDMGQQVVFPRKKRWALNMSHKKARTGTTGALDGNSRDSCGGSMEKLEDPWEGLEPTVKLFSVR